MNFEASSKLKILHIISGDLWAGAETMAFNLLRILKGYNDLEISVILLNDGRLASELKTAGLGVHVINENLHSLLCISRKIRKFVVCNQPDIIHSHRYKENLLAFLAGRNRGIKLVSTQHGLPEIYANKPAVTQRFKTLANFLLLSRFFTTVAVSKDIRQSLIDRSGFPSKKLEVIHNGVDLPKPKATGTETGDFVIGSSGRLFPVKDYPLMVEVARAIAATGANGYRFDLAGDGPDRPALESQVRHYGLGHHFSIKGHVEDMEDFYQRLNVYLNTSIHEGIPMTILEALGHGLPVIAPAVGGIVEIIDNGIEGFLVTDRNPRDFAEKCLLLKEDRELRERMSRAAREKAQKCFSAEIMAGKYYKLYHRLAFRKVMNGTQITSDECGFQEL